MAEHVYDIALAALPDPSDDDSASDDEAETDDGARTPPPADPPAQPPAIKRKRPVAREPIARDIDWYHNRAIEANRLLRAQAEQIARLVVMVRDYQQTINILVAVYFNTDEDASV